MIENNIKITSREIEVINLIGKGCSTKEVAKILSLSIYTVETHRKNILKKMEAKNMVDAIMKYKTMDIDFKEIYL